MAVSSRKVQNKRDSNGVLTGKAGTVYDVNIKYTGQDGKKKSYAKKGFATKKEATQHEAEMKAKLANPIYSPVVASQGKQTVKEYLEEWVENHGKANLRPSTFAGYKSHIRNHIVPYIGHVQLNQLTPAMLDNMFQQLFDKGLSNSTVRYAQRILSVSMEHARKYRYIEHNPARDIITKFGKQAKTPDPYTIEQMQTFMSNVIGTEWEMPVVLAGMYGLRMSEIIGLRTTNIDLEKMQFGVVEQMPFKVPPGTKTITEMAPTKSNDRILPITEEALPYFLRQFDLIARQKALTEAGGGVYYDNKLFIAKPDGSPQRRDRMSANFGQLIRHLEMPHIRFHDLRHPYVKYTTKIFSLRSMAFQAQAYPDARRKTRGACQLHRGGQSRSPVRPLCNRKRFSCLPPQSKISRILYAISIRLSGYTSTRSISSSASSVVSVSASKIALDASMRLSCRACSSRFCFACANTAA